MIPNIVFDLGGVLVYYDTDRIMDFWSIAGEDRKILKYEVFQSLEWVQLDRGTISFEDAVSQVSGRLPERLHRPAAEMMTGWYYRALEPIPGMQELMKELVESGHRLYILSNANTDFDAYVSRIPGAELCSGAFASAHHQLLKPEHEIYEAFLREFSLKGSECFFIDDSPANVQAAVRCGFHGCVGHQDAERIRREIAAAEAEN